MTSATTRVMGLRFLLLLLLATAGVPPFCSGSSRALAGEADDLFERVIRPYLPVEKGQG